MLAEALDFEELAIDALAEVAQGDEILDAVIDIEILRVVDHG